MSKRILNVNTGKGRLFSLLPLLKSSFDLLLSVVLNINSVMASKCLVSVKFILLVYLGSEA